MLETLTNMNVGVLALQENAEFSQGVTEFGCMVVFAVFMLTLHVAIRCGIFLPFEIGRRIGRRLAKSRAAQRLASKQKTITLGLGSFAEQAASAQPPELESCCATCQFAHTITGYNPGEQLVSCAYSFPPQFILFKVKECTDYKQKRERIGVGIAIEGAVSHPHFVQQAANSRAAAAVSPSARE